MLMYLKCNNYQKLEKPIPLTNVFDRNGRFILAEEKYVNTSREVQKFDPSRVSLPN